MYTIIRTDKVKIQDGAYATRKEAEQRLAYNKAEYTFLYKDAEVVEITKESIETRLLDIATEVNLIRSNMENIPADMITTRALDNYNILHTFVEWLGENLNK